MRFEEGEFTNKYTEFVAAKKSGFKGLQRRVSTAHQRGTAAAAGGGMQRQSADACPACCAVFRSRTLDNDEYNRIGLVLRKQQKMEANDAGAGTTHEPTATDAPNSEGLCTEFA